MPEPEEKEHPWSTPDRLAVLSNEPFGQDLMRQVAQRLQTVPTGIRHCHPEYCGHGLFFSDGVYQLAEFQDCEPRQTLQSWKDEQAFVEFWAAQSDRSCSGVDVDCPAFAARNRFNLNNQRITKERLVKFAQG